MTTVLLLGTLDTKGQEYAFVQALLARQGIDTLVMDVGVLGVPLLEADISRDQVADAAGTDLSSVIASGDRGNAIDLMLNGAQTLATSLVEQGKVHGIFGMGGSGGSTLISRVMRALPTGFPKLLVSTVASGDTRAYVGNSDIAMMSSIVDIAGINQLSERILTNAAGALAGMALAYEGFVPSADSKPVIGATMFGVTTPCVTVARERLESLGYEVMVFHATGVGGDTMESLIQQGIITGVLDSTTTELADLVVGGTLAAGPDRFVSAGARGLPQVVSLGALDMVNFGAIETVPDRFRKRLLHRHNAAITLMRTTPEENAALGGLIAEKLNAATGPVSLFIPTRGVSMIDVAGQPFFNPEADAALFAALRQHIGPNVTVIERDTDINDPAFATEMADRLDRLYREWSATRSTATHEDS